jgi:putative addiction module CopG family antidote
MKSISIKLPTDLEPFVEASVLRGRFSSESDYVVALIAAARDGRSHTESALLEGLASGPAEPWTDDEWAALKQRVADKNALSG